MKTSSISSLSITFINFLILSIASLPQTTSSNSDSDSDLIPQICKQTPHYDLCLSSLQPNSNATDIKQLASAITNLVLSNATDTLTYIKALIKQSDDPKLEHALANCAEFYINVVKDDIPQAIEALTKGWYGFTEYVMNDAGKAANSCEKSLGGGGNESPLGDRNKVVSDLCDVAVAIIHVLIKS